MKLFNNSISKLVEYIVGDDYQPYRSGPQLIKLFNEYGGYDYLPSKGMPLMPNSSLKFSRKNFAEQKMVEMNDTFGLQQLIEHVINQSESPSVPAKINTILSKDGYSVAKEQDSYKITGGVIDNSDPISNEAYFQNLEKKVLDALNEAKVSIHVAIAWFTNENIKAKLLEKKKAGVDVDVVIYGDGINGKHGVDLSELPHTFVKGSRGGIMHDKFCIIDNQVVINGSYNWTINAETKNDENVSVMKDPKSATDFTLKFKELKSNKKEK